MASVDLVGVEKSFGATRVLKGIDVSIADGAFVVLVGPSGCGKSTLLRTVAGLETIDGGEIRIDGRRVDRVAPKDRDIAMVFQNYALYPHMTVAENMGFSLAMKRRPKAEIAEKVGRAAEILGLADLLSRRPAELSGGQRQRVAMGRAIVRDPRVFLFDEPLSNLDAKLRVQMRAEIRELQQRLGTTTIYVTHDQIEAMTMADTIVILDRGRVVQTGAPLEVYDRPADLFVATFIGSPAMNVLDGRLEAGRITFGGEASLAIDAPDLHGREVRYGIRPEHLDLVEPGTSAALPGEVAVVEPTGSEVLITARTCAGPLTAVFRERHRLVPGQRIALAPRPGTQHLFDRDGGRRLVSGAQG